MSHVASVTCKVRDLSDLREAAARRGLVLVEGQTTHRWYGRFLDDWHSERAAARKGRDPATFGTCAHALRLADAGPGDYEVGVVDEGDGSYALVYDTFGPGQRLEQAAGVDLVGLYDELLAVAATRTLTMQGYMVEREDHEGRIELLARG